MKKLYYVEIIEDISAECDGSSINERSGYYFANNHNEAFATFEHLLGRHLLSISVRVATFVDYIRYFIRK